MGYSYQIAGEELEEFFRQYPTNLSDEDPSKYPDGILKDWPRSEKIEIINQATGETKQYSHPKRDDVEAIVATITENPDLLGFIKAWSHQNGYLNLGLTATKFKISSQTMAPPPDKNRKFTFINQNDKDIELIESFDIPELLIPETVDEDGHSVKPKSEDSLMSVTVKSKLSIGDDGRVKYEILSYNIEIKDELEYKFIHAISPSLSKEYVCHYLDQFHQELVDLESSMEEAPEVKEEITDMKEKIREHEKNIMENIGNPERVESELQALKKEAFEKSQKPAIKNYSEAKGVFQNIVEGCRKLLNNLFPSVKYFHSKPQNMLLNTPKYKSNKPKGPKPEIKSKKDKPKRD